jgi:hypothetical protein
MNKAGIIKLSISFLIGLALIFISPKLHSQSYDGADDRKIFLGATVVGDNFGIEFQTDQGAGDWVSYGGKIIYLLHEFPDGSDEFDRASLIFSNLDVAGFMRFHFSAPLNLSEKTDPYLGMDVSLKSIGAHAGFKYNFSETLGVYSQVGYGFFGSFFGPTPRHSEDEDFINRFAKRTGFSVGITVNIWNPYGYMQ